MAHRFLFQSHSNQANTVNHAGGTAYALSNQSALAQLAVTGCFNNTYYADGAEQLDTLLQLARKVSDSFLAQTALFARKQGLMKDTPALLCALLAKRNFALLEEIFPQVIDNGKMLRNFVQMIRSGVTGRSSLGTAPRRLVRQWLARATDEQLLFASVGNSPSLADVIKMVHPRPTTPQRDAFYAWLLGKDPSPETLPHIIQDFEMWKAHRDGPPPNVPFQFLTNQDLGTEDWAQIARNASWQMTRMNLNTFARQGVFDDPELTKLIATRLADQKHVKRARAFPYQLMAAFLNASSDVPTLVTNALQDAMEIATSNVPQLEGEIVICPDVSGSMHSSVTGYRQGSTSKVRCVDVAALIAATILRKNPQALVLPFMEKVVRVKLNPRDSIMTNAKKLSGLPCGGTNCSAPLAWLNKHRRRPDFIFFISDNESWVDSPHYGWSGGGRTGAMREWLHIKQRSPRARMACLDIQPNTTTQVQDRPDVLNLGGFSDQIFTIISQFHHGKMKGEHLVNQIKQIPLYTQMNSFS